uniref:HPC2 and ubinuclein domain containing protein, putative n=1 Tax=Theileria annulata TaxID=5874 RepID=A0A3B0N3M7_THEAN
MSNLQDKVELTVNSNANESIINNNNPNVLESSNSDNKIKENASNAPVLKHKTNGKHPKEEEDLVEQDLSDVEDNYREPSVQRYLPGIFVDVDLKTNFLERKGKKIAIPMIVDFYSECLKKYGEEKNFIYEESYLENMKGKVEDFYPDLPKIPKGANETLIDTQSQTNVDNKQVPIGSEVQKTVNFDENLDDVIWLKNRPNDPLLRCIRSITDRLNIQGIVGDPTSYLKKGGDDMHYDMDDPFFDDSAMLSELKMSKSDILLKRAMEKEFSDWSEDEEDSDYNYVEPEDFVADYYSIFQKDIKQHKEMESEYNLYFYPTGWRDYLSKIPKRFHNIYVEFESQVENTTEPITDKFLRLKVKELLESIYKRLLKLKIVPKTPKRTRKSKKNETEEEPSESNQVNNEEIPSQTESKQDENEPVTVEEDKTLSKPKTNPNEIPKEILKKRGLNCMLHYGIIDVNGKILRWIVKSITSMTNAYSPFEIHCEWFNLVVANNEKVLAEQSNKLKSKLTNKLQSLKPKKLENLISQLSESSKTLSKSIGIIRKVLKEHREATIIKTTQCSKEVKEPTQRKSLIEISLDSAREDHEEYMGSSQPLPKQVPKPDELAKAEDETILQLENIPLYRVEDINVSDDLDKKDTYEINFQEANVREENDDMSCASSSNSSTQDISSLSRLEDYTNNGTPMPKSDQLINFKETDLKDKNESNALTDSTIKTPKRSGQKDEDLDEILKQSKIMKRVKDVYNLFKLVGNEALAFVQVNNLAIYVANKINDKEFKHVVDHLGLTQNPFDQTYRRLGEIGSKVIQELYNLKVNLPTDVMKVVVINLQNHLKVEELYEKKNKKPLLLFNNSKIKASPGKVYLTPPKSKTPRKTPKADTSKNIKSVTSENGSWSNEVKPSPRKRKDTQNLQHSPTPIKNKEDGNKEIQEPEKKRKRTQSQSRVNSLKDLFLSRLR